MNAAFAAGAGAGVDLQMRHPHENGIRRTDPYARAAKQAQGIIYLYFTGILRKFCGFMHKKIVAKTAYPDNQ